MRQLFSSDWLKRLKLNDSLLVQGQDFRAWINRDTNYTKVENLVSQTAKWIDTFNREMGIVTDYNIQADQYLFTRIK